MFLFLIFATSENTPNEVQIRFMTIVKHKTQITNVLRIFLGVFRHIFYVSLDEITISYLLSRTRVYGIVGIRFGLFVFLCDCSVGFMNYITAVLRKRHCNAYFVSFKCKIACVFMRFSSKSIRHRNEYIIIQSSLSIALNAMF